jgi:hypothetical protein
MALPSAPWFDKIANLVFLRDRVREARASQPLADAERVRAANQARLLVEVARRVGEPVEALPVGAPASVQLGLYAEAIFWALVAGGAAPQAGMPLVAVWENARPDSLLKAASGDAEAVASLKSLLCERPPGGDLGTRERDVAAARKFAEALVWELDAPARRIEHLLVNRWVRVGVLAGVVIAAAFGIRALMLGPNLIADRPFQTSTTLEQCAHKGMCADVMFHTLQQDNPWAEFDIGSVKPVHRVELTNRSDCCAERIAGVVVELSTDRKTWTEVAHNDQIFSKWSPTFPKRLARYVRVRLPRPSAVLHLDDFAVR